MKLLNLAILATALCFPLAGCGGDPAPGEHEAPTDVGEAPAEMEPAETAPPLEAPK
jgi:hypothetical protein